MGPSIQHPPVRSTMKAVRVAVPVSVRPPFLRRLPNARSGNLNGPHDVAAIQLGEHPGTAGDEHVCHPQQGIRFASVLRSVFKRLPAHQGQPDLEPTARSALRRQFDQPHLYLAGRHAGRVGRRAEPQANDTGRGQYNQLHQVALQAIGQVRFLSRRCSTIWDAADVTPAVSVERTHAGIPLRPIFILAKRFEAVRDCRKGELAPIVQPNHDPPHSMVRVPVDRGDGAYLPAEVTDSIALDER